MPASANTSRIGALALAAVAVLCGIYAFGLAYETALAPETCCGFSGARGDPITLTRAADLAAHTDPQAERLASLGGAIVTARAADPHGWFVQAEADALRPAGLTASGNAALSRSYEAAAFDLRLSARRALLAAGNWARLTPVLRASLAAELRMAREYDDVLAALVDGLPTVRDAEGAAVIRQELRGARRLPRGVAL